MRALTFDAFGGPEVLRYREVPDPALPPGHALVRMRAVGLNFADVYRRRGRYHLAGSPPYVAGYEGAGVVEAVRPPEAPGDDGAAPDAPLAYHAAAGDRVGFADSPYANAELVAVPLGRLVPLPDDVSFETAAAVLLQGLTAQYLVSDSYRVRPGDDVLVHAAAGGVGQLLVQLAVRAGGRVLGLTSSAHKRLAAERAGCDRVVLLRDDWVMAARAWSRGGRGADVAYDSVGGTLDDSLRAARVGGTVVFYGMAGGDPAPVDPRRLMDESKALVGGDLWNVLTTPAERVRRAGALFALVRGGALRVEVARAFPLADGAAAHRFLEGGESAGKVLLVP
jgi:NADPH2:quinone reductase